MLFIFLVLLPFSTLRCFSLSLLQSDDENEIGYCFVPPKYPMSNYRLCNETNAEWSLELYNWKYDKIQDLTYTQYRLCISDHNPYNPCNNNQYPQPLSFVFLQLPCLCEVCMKDITHSLTSHGSVSQIFKAWVWDDVLELPFTGECQFLQITLHGYANLEESQYILFGDNRYVLNNISIPNPCSPIITDDIVPHLPALDQSIFNECISKPYYPEECIYSCNYNHTEWSIEFLYNLYNNNTNITTFTYKIQTFNDNSLISCNMNDIPENLEYVILKLPCSSTLYSNTFLKLITNNMSPFGFVDKLYWYWYLDNLSYGKSMELNITLSGNISTINGDFTLGGSGRCTTGKIKLPNPYSNPCYYGQWSSWQGWGDCSQTCGGGELYRSRTCVSVCDGVTPLENCPGEAFIYIPCNTIPCTE